MIEQINLIIGEMMQDGLYKDLTYKIIGAAMEVHNTLGPGFLEKVYQNALEQELFYRKVGFSSQTSYIVKYKNKKAGIYRPDLTAENIIIIEIKAVSDLNLNLAAAQLISYLSATKIQGGIINKFWPEEIRI